MYGFLEMINIFIAPIDTPNTLFNLEPTPSKPSLFPAFTVTVLLNFHIKKHCFLLKI